MSIAGFKLRRDHRGLIVPLALLAAGEIAFRAGHVQSDSLAAPSAILESGLRALMDGAIWTATGETLYTASCGLALGAAIGLISGLVLGLSRIADRLLDVSIEALRPVPSVALIPLAMLVFGFGYSMEIAVVAFATIWPILLLVRAAIASVEPRLMEVSRALSLSLAARVTKIILPAILPRMFVAFRLAVGIALIVAVTVEIAANPLGLGYAMMIAQQSLHPDLMFALLLWIGFVGWSLNALLLRAQTRLFGRGRHGRCRAMMQGRHLLWTAASVIAALALVCLWQVIADLKLISPIFLPAPSRAWAVMVRGLSAGDLGWKVLGTIERMAYGWLLASLVGVALGAVIGSSSAMRAYLNPMLEFLRPLPASAIIPVGIALLGLTDAMVLAVIAFGSLWPMLLATVHGFAAVEPRLYEVGRLLGFSRRSVIVKLALPSAMPDILAGMRLGLTVALILAVVGEMLAGRDGLGQWILLAARSFRSADLFAGIILLGVIGYLTSLLLNAVEHRVLLWRADGRARS